MLSQKIDVTAAIVRNKEAFGGDSVFTNPCVVEIKISLRRGKEQQCAQLGLKHPDRIRHK